MEEKKGYTTISTTLPQELKIAALRRTYEIDITMSQYVRHLIRADLERAEEEKRQKEMRKDSEL